MLNNQPHPSESRDRNVQALNNKLTNIRNAKATAIDNDDWDRVTQLQADEQRLTADLEAAFMEKY